jgi:hypothetical protein
VNAGLEDLGGITRISAVRRSCRGVPGSRNFYGHSMMLMNVARGKWGGRGNEGKDGEREMGKEEYLRLPSRGSRQAIVLARIGTQSGPAGQGQGL